MITHGNLGHNLTIITNELKAKDDTIVCSWLPLYHDMGLIGSYLGCLYCGGSGYYLSPLTFLQRPMIWMEAVSKYQATHLQAPNFSFKLVARKFDASQYTKDNLQLSSVRHVINAAEPVDEDSIETFYKSFCAFGFPRVIYPTYGLAEHTVFVCSGGTQRLSVNKHELEVNGKVVPLPNDTNGDTVSRMIGCGYPKRQDVDVRIVETETCKALGNDTVGEIWVHSDSKAAGYFNKEKETKEDFHARLSSDSTGSEYLRTGDLGFLHDDELFICGRLKDLIIVGGRNYYPQDIEATAESAGNDLVRLGCSAAFTIDPTHQGGEEVALVMELKEVPPSQTEIDKVGQQLANSIKAAINTEHSLGIAQIIFLKPRTVPKTSSGKIARAWCRKGFLAGTLTILYTKSFKKVASMEIEGGRPAANNNAAHAAGGGPSSSSQGPLTPAKIEELRALDKKAIVGKLVVDVNRMGGSLDPSSGVTYDSAIVTFLDSLTISQFKGLLESNYATKLSDEYLFRETTSLNKLAEVVKLGYAPDDDLEGNGEGRVPEGVGSQGGKAEGIAGMLGCPPGVVCCVIS